MGVSTLQKRMVCRLRCGWSSSQFSMLSKNVFAHSSLGKPKMPLPMAGKLMLLSLSCSASSIAAQVTEVSFATSSPVPQTGPTAWITNFASNSPPPVMAALPVSTLPCSATQAVDSV